jgi:hypothetical protein
MPKLREFLVRTYPGATALKEADIVDPSFADELERSGLHRSALRDVANRLFGASRLCAAPNVP